MLDFGFVKFEIVASTRVEMVIGTFEAESEEAAMELAYASDRYQERGGICHHCTKRVGDEGETEMIVFVVDNAQAASGEK